MNVQDSIATENVGNLSAITADAPERRSGLSEAEFIAEYRDPRRPVILTDAAREWPVYGRGTPEHFRSNYGDVKVSVWGTDYRLADLLDLLEVSSIQRPGPYPCKFVIAQDFRKLLAEVSPRFGYSLPDRPDFERYPLFRAARSQKAVIHAGETLFLPCGWWHTARSLNMTISVAFDQLGPDNWSAFTGDVVSEQRRHGRGGKALLLGMYLRSIDPLLGLAERFSVNRSRKWGLR